MGQVLPRGLVLLTELDLGPVIQDLTPQNEKKEAYQK
jgi:hypothetical protein